MNTKPTYYSLDEEAARTAHRMNSMRGYSSDLPAYRAEVDNFFALADKAAERAPERAGEAYELADRFSRKMAEWHNEGYRIASMCPSILASGGANFPVRRKQRQNQASDRHYRKLDGILGIRESIRKLGTSAETIKCGDADAADRLREKIAKLKAAQEAMKEANREARKAGKEAPHPSWELSNNNQNIHATERRLRKLEEAKEAGTSQRRVEVMGEDAVAVENAEIMRLQLVFDGKPPEEVREALKSRGFRWSPNNGAWQRQLTDNARHALRLLEKQQ